MGAHHGSIALSKMYEVGELLGRGGMGAVYAAEHRVTRRPVAIKYIQARDVRDDVALRFRREALAAGSIDSPHVVRVLDAGWDEEQALPFLVMERLFGQDLGALLREQPWLPPDGALRIVAHVLRGLCAVHAAGFVHRDVKPGNIFLATDANHALEAKLLDFGIAKFSADMLVVGDTDVSRTGTVVGSPQYMSPEQALGLKDVDARSDIWSVGIVLFKCLSGSTPHDESSLAQLLIDLCTTPPPDVRTRAPWISSRVAELVVKATQMRREDRYPSAAAMLAAVEGVLADDPALLTEQALRVTDSLKARVSAAPPRQQLRERTEVDPFMLSKHRSKKSRTPWLVAGSCAIVAGLGISASQRSKEPAESKEPVRSASLLGAPSSTLPAVSLDRPTLEEADAGVALVAPARVAVPSRTPPTTVRAVATGLAKDPSRPTKVAESEIRKNFD